MTVDEDKESSEGRTRTFFDLGLGLHCGRIIFELYSDLLPKTCENFRALCTGEVGIGKNTDKPLHYKVNTSIYNNNSFSACSFYLLSYRG